LVAPTIGQTHVTIALARHSSSHRSTTPDLSQRATRFFRNSERNRERIESSLLASNRAARSVCPMSRTLDRDIGAGECPAGPRPSPIEMFDFASLDQRLFVGRDDFPRVASDFSPPIVDSHLRDDSMHPSASALSVDLDVLPTCVDDFRQAMRLFQRDTRYLTASILKFRRLDSEFRSFKPRICHCATQKPGTACWLARTACE
jgi:hypothetical protein